MRTNNHAIGGISFMLILLLVWCPLAVGQEEGSGEAQETQQDTGDYLIGPGDLIQVVVWKNVDLSGEFRVRPDGKLSMPLIGDVIVGGKTTEEVNMQIQDRLKLYIESPFVSTIVSETASNRVFVLGEVNAPGTYPIEGSLTILQALALAGGFTEFAIRDRLVLVRGSGEKQEKFTLSYRNILTEPGGESNMVLKRGDTLVVP